MKNKNITKKFLAYELSKDQNIHITLAAEFINEFFNIKKNMLNTNGIKFHNFGSYKISKTPERIGRNPKTKQSYIIKKRKRVSFQLSKKYKDLVK